MLTRHEMAVYLSRRAVHFLRGEDRLAKDPIDPPLTPVELNIPLFEEAYRSLLHPNCESTPERRQYHRSLLRVMLPLAREIEANGQLPEMLARLLNNGIEC